MKKRIVMVMSAFLVAMTLLAIWHFSAQDASKSGALSGSFTQIVAKLPWLDGLMSLDALDHIVRKFAHGLIYLVLGFGLAGIVVAQRTRLIIVAVPLVGMVLAMMDEFHQSFVPGRGPSVRDVLIDTAGVCLGMLLLLGLRQCYRCWRRRSLENPS